MNKDAKEQKIEDVREKSEDLFSCGKGLVGLKLSPAVRKAFVAHACWNSGLADCGKKLLCANSCSHLSQKDRIACGGIWLLKGREDGYPPRSG